MKYLTIISHAGASECDRRLEKLAEWMGVPTRRIELQTDDTVERILPEILAVGGGCFAVSAATLALFRAELERHLFAPATDVRRRAVLVFGWTPSSKHEDILRTITEGFGRGLVPPSVKKRVSFPVAGRQFTKYLADLSFCPNSTSRPTVSFHLGRASPGGGLTLMEADSLPVFVKQRLNTCDLYLLASSGVPDIDQPLEHQHRLEEYYDQLIPLLVFLRHEFSDQCWLAPRPTARLIIDDPLLTQKYGFLDHDVLARSMRSVRYGMSIAFIPWNHWRTARNTASDIFNSNANLSICVHGCDHTNREFDSTDSGLLNSKAGLALERMRWHTHRTGVPFERVMVFPQGRFSTAAIAALRAEGYLAAVNTTCFPTDDLADALTMRDFLRPAVTRFHGFPIFQRRYPKSITDSAFDLFLGKPAFLVEHHEYFREGCKRIEEFVHGLNSTEPELEWTDLSSQVSSSCVVRAADPSTTEVEFYTNHFFLKHALGVPKSFRFMKREPIPSVVSAVLVNGQNHEFAVENGTVRVDVQVEPRQRVSVEIVDRPSRPLSDARRSSTTYRLKVSTRRLLSEFRDNTLARHPRLLGAATEAARVLGATGGDDREHPGISSASSSRGSRPFEEAPERLTK